VKINGKHICILDLPPECLGNGQAIFDEIKQTEDGKLRQIREKDSLEEFKRVIAVKDKTIINFIL